MNQPKTLRQQQQELLDRWLQSEPEQKSRLVLEWIRLKESMENQDGKSRPASSKAEARETPP